MKGRFLSLFLFSNFSQVAFIKVGAILTLVTVRNVHSGYGSSVLRMFTIILFVLRSGCVVTITGHIVVDLLYV